MSAAAFSTLQTRCLDALGYTRHVLAGATDQAVTPSTQADAAMAIVSSEPVRMSSASRSSHSTSALPAHANARGNSKLLDAILRAAGSPAYALAEPLAWLQGLGVSGLDALRADPFAKRALWIRLRAERRAR